MATQHTPGPLVVRRIGTDPPDCFTVNEDRSGGGTLVAICEGPQAEANAHLIAAAPGMLETLYRVRNFLACSGKALANSNCARVVDEQIAQAEGGAK